MTALGFVIQNKLTKEFISANHDAYMDEPYVFSTKNLMNATIWENTEFAQRYIDDLKNKDIAQYIKNGLNIETDPLYIIPIKIETLE